LEKPGKPGKSDKMEHLPAIPQAVKISENADATSGLYFGAPHLLLTFYTSTRAISFAGFLQGGEVTSKRVRGEKID
jgi:hypothetical protein